MSWGVTAVAGATVVGGYLSGQQAAGAQQDANRANLALSREGTAEQRRQFGVGQETRALDVERQAEMTGSRRAREEEINRMTQERFEGMRAENLQRLAPYAQAGEQALGQQQALLGLTGEEAQQAAFSRISESPGQAFLRERQERALLRGASAIGGLGGGNVRTALQEQAFKRAQTDIDEQLQRLSGLTGPGLQAARGGLEAGAGPGYIQTAADIGVATETATGPQQAADRAKAAAIKAGEVAPSPVVATREPHRKFFGTMSS